MKLEPVAYRYDVLIPNDKQSDAFDDFWATRITERAPKFPDSDVRNLTPLYAIPLGYALVPENNLNDVYELLANISPASDADSIRLGVAMEEIQRLTAAAKGGMMNYMPIEAFIESIAERNGKLRRWNFPCCIVEFDDGMKEPRVVLDRSHSGGTYNAVVMMTDRSGINISEYNPGNDTAKIAVKQALMRWNLAMVG